MNKIEKGKKTLIIFGAVGILLSILAICFGVVLIVNGIKDLASAGGIISLVFGIILCLLFPVLIVFGIYLCIMGMSVKAVNGSIKQDNLGSGTVNMNKCSNCGVEVKEGQNFCPECGKSLLTTKTCECGAENPTEAKVCVKCGKKF